MLKSNETPKSRSLVTHHSFRVYYQEASPLSCQDALLSGFPLPRDLTSEFLQSTRYPINYNLSIQSFLTYFEFQFLSIL